MTDLADETTPTVLVDIDPARTALVVLNPLQGAVDYDPETAKVFAHVKIALDAARASGTTVVFSSLLFNEDHSDANPVQFACYGEDGLMRRSDPGAKIVADLTPLAGEIVLERNRFSAFYNSDLESLLTERDIDTIVLAGSSTNYCTDSTARDASFRDYRVVVLSDGTAPATIELAGRTLSGAESQDFALSTLRQGFAEIASVQSLVDALRHSSS